MPAPKPKPSRREQYALATKQAIIDAGRRLFAERGYFATKVDDIAAEAEVAPATVYAVVGGKQGLLNALSETWTSEPGIKTTLEYIKAAEDPAELIGYMARRTRERREQFADVMRILITTAPHDTEIAQQLQPATDLYRATLGTVARRLGKLGSLREGISADEAADVLWFYLGYSSYTSLHDESGWSYERAERWLTQQCRRALLE
jgi:AcrR family transcriptional regulator